MIAVIDYGMGNIHSVKKALECFDQKAFIARKGADLRRADKIVLPGVGAFGDAIAELQKRGLDRAIRQGIAAGKPFLGICLGMQVLFEKSSESPGADGLGILKGAVKKFPRRKGLKVPHMGWNCLKRTTHDARRKAGCYLLKGIPGGAYVYFCHSYYAEPAGNKAVAASCDYGKRFAAVVCRDNIFGVQFHPEKSQRVGLRILRNFVKL